MAQGDEWTIGRLLQWTTDYLREHGSSSPRLDAELLLAHARHCQRIELYTCFGDPASTELRAEFRELVRQRATGMPVAYLIGEREFYSLPFRVTPDVLIPRPETEFVLITLLDLIKKSNAGVSPRIVDVGTGSGALAVSVAVHVPAAKITAIDISAAALQIAEENARRHQVEDRIEFLQGDLLLPVADRTFDYIISNPPYVSTAEFAQLPADVRHEPEVALLGGASGTDVIARLIGQTAGRLVSDGWLILEISPMIEQPVRELLASPAEFEDVSVLRDLSQHARVVRARHAPS